MKESRSAYSFWRTEAHPLSLLRSLRRKYMHFSCDYADLFNCSFFFFFSVLQIIALFPCRENQYLEKPPDDPKAGKLSLPHMCGPSEARSHSLERSSDLEATLLTILP